MKTQLSVNLPSTRFPVPREDPAKYKARMKKQQQQREILQSLGIDTSFRLDALQDPLFSTKDEQEEYEKDCFLATMFVKTGAEIPEELKTRLLKVKHRREACAE